MGSVNRCQVGFVPWLLIKHIDKYNGILVQVTGIYTAAADSKYRRQKVYKSHGFAEVVLITKCDTTKQSDEALINKKDQKKTQLSEKSNWQNQRKCDL